jgi:2-polyprenyl-3-methyl-5-hydroxy-6-metoxy-1,4-benzoquinol methylase
MLSRDWFHNDRGRVGLDFAVAERAAAYEGVHGEGARARSTLSTLGIEPGWRVADIGCGSGELACEAARRGADVLAIDVSPAMLALAELHAREMKVKIKTQAAGLLSFACEADSLDLMVSEFTLHHLPDFWKAVALSRIYRALKPGGTFFLRDIVYVNAPDGVERSIAQWSDFAIKNHEFSRDDVTTHMRDEHSTFGWVIEGLLKNAGFTLEQADYHAPLYGTYVARKPANGG